jgi:hypothetical protein
MNRHDRQLLDRVQQAVDDNRPWTDGGVFSGKVLPPTLTKAEDAHHAALNERIMACPHLDIRRIGDDVRCTQCPARFVVMFFPRSAGG